MLIAVITYYLCPDMKKGVAAILLTVYLAFSSGLVVNLHYCMDRFDSMQIGGTSSDYCGKCGMHTDESNGCCHDTVQILKIDDDQLATTIAFNFKAPEALPQIQNEFIDALILVEQSVIFSKDHSPPLSKQDIYLQNCVFRI